MATLLARLQGRAATESNTDTIPGVDLVTPEEARVLFDQRARTLLGISGDKFLRPWDADEFRSISDNAEGRKEGEFVMMMPFARRTTA